MIWEGGLLSWHVVCAVERGPIRDKGKTMERTKLLLFTAIMFSLLLQAAQAQQSSSELQKIALCGPNSLYRRFAERPEILPGEGGVHIRNPNTYFDQEGKTRILQGDIYILKFQGWSINQSFPGGQTEALRFFEYHCSRPGRGNHPVVMEKK